MLRASCRPPLVNRTGPLADPFAPFGAVRAGFFAGCSSRVYDDGERSSIPQTSLRLTSTGVDPRRNASRLSGYSSRSAIASEVQCADVVFLSEGRAADHPL